MSLGLAFWVLMLIWAIFWVSWNFGGMWGEYGPRGNAVLLFVLFALLGWHEFGPPLHG